MRSIEFNVLLAKAGCFQSYHLGKLQQQKNMDCIKKYNKMAKLGPHFVQLKIEDQMIKMKFDKNSSVSVMNQEQYFSLFQNSLCETKINSINVDGSNLVIIGQTNVLVECCNSVFNLTLLIAHAEYDFIPVMFKLVEYINCRVEN